VPPPPFFFFSLLSYNVKKFRVLLYLTILTLDVTMKLWHLNANSIFGNFNFNGNPYNCFTRFICKPFGQPGVDFLLIGRWAQFLDAQLPRFCGQIFGRKCHEKGAQISKTLVDCKGKFSSHKVRHSGTQLPLNTRNWPQTTFIIYQSNNIFQS
jgi:hypothetical protein